MIENSLKPLNTFGIQAVAKRVIKATSPEGLLAAWRTAQDNNEPVLVLGEGSNVLFLEDFAGTVILNRIMGAEVTEQPDSWLLHVGAGENWHEFVQWTLMQGWPGLENLSLIPGTVGAAPIQNIGAYGLEACDRFHALTAFDMQRGKTLHFDRAGCRFGYRDSVFKQEGWHLDGRFVITDVTFRLPKHWQPQTRGALVASPANPTGEMLSRDELRALADVLVRDPQTLAPLPMGQPGLLQLLSALPLSYPGHSLLSEDLGVLLGEDDCRCGRQGRYFSVLGRQRGAEVRGCSDTFQ